MSKSFFLPGILLRDSIIWLFFLDPLIRQEDSCVSWLTPINTG